MGRLPFAISGVAAAVLCACGASSRERGGPVASPTSDRPRLYLAGDGEMWIVDTASDRVRHLILRRLSPGDPPYRIVRRGRRLVLWGYDTWVTGPGVRRLHPLVRGSWFFIPSAAPDRVWVTFLDARRPSRARHLGAVREVTATGRVTVPDAPPPGGNWPQAAATAGLLFFADGRYELWDPRGRVVLRTFLPSAIGYPGPVFGNLLASCTGACGVLRLTDLATGATRRLRAPRGTTFEMPAAAFSPDGRTLSGGRASGPRPPAHRPDPDRRGQPCRAPVLLRRVEPRRPRGVLLRRQPATHDPSLPHRGCAGATATGPRGALLRHGRAVAVLVGRDGAGLAARLVSILARS